MEEPADFRDEYWFIRKESGRVVGVNFNDVRVVMMETAVKIKRMDTIEYSIGEYVVSCGGHILSSRCGLVHALEDERSRCSESGNLRSRMGGWSKNRL